MFLLTEQREYFMLLLAADPLVPLGIETRESCPNPPQRFHVILKVQSNMRATCPLMKVS